MYAKTVVPDTYALWMNTEYTAGGGWEVLPSLVQPGDHIDLLAHMDLLVAISACPGWNPPRQGRCP